VVAKETNVVEPALQTTCETGCVTCAVGLTIMVNVFVGPVQFTLPLLKFGVTIIVAVTGDDPEFTAVKAGIFPVPEAVNPIEVVLLVQE
jgi:hypothetical protein